MKLLITLPESRLIKGRKYLDVSRPEWRDMEPIFKLIKEVMAGRARREITVC